MARFDVGEALWGPSRDIEPDARSGWRAYLGVTAAVMLLRVLRRTDGVTNPQFWAEDGSVLFQDNLALGCWRALHTFYQGFPYLEQRLVACASTPFPIVSVPLVYHLVAYAIAAASLASFSLLGFRHVIRSDARRAVFCLAVAALPMATPLVGSLTNTGWFLGIWLMLLTIARLPRSRIALAALSLACLVATFSTPLSVLTAPLWLARALHAMRRRLLREACFATLALCSVLALLLVAGGLGRDPQAHPGLARPWLASVSLLVLANGTLGWRTVLGLTSHCGPGVVHVSAVALLTVLGALAWRSWPRSVPMLLFCAYGILGSTALPILGHAWLATITGNIATLLGLESSAWFPWRYYVVPVSMLYLALLATIDRLPGGRSRSIATVVLLAWLVATEAPTFVLEPFYDLQWHAYAARLERKLADRSPEPLSIPVNPDRSGFFFNISVDRRAIAPEANIPGDDILGTLADTTFEQSFVARCPNLSAIYLLFGKEGHAGTQAVHVELRDEETGHVVETFVLNGADIVGAAGPEAEARVAMMARQAEMNGVRLTQELARTLAGVGQPTALYFAPIASSQDRRYVIAVTASGGAPGDSVTVFGSTANAYADGEARINGTPVPGDLAFRYGCTPP